MDLDSNLLVYAGVAVAVVLLVGVASWVRRDRSRRQVEAWQRGRNITELTLLVKPATRPYERKAAIAALKELEKAATLSTLLSETKDAGIRRELVDALVSMGPEAAGALAKGSASMPPREREATMEALVRMGPEAIEPIIQVLKVENSQMVEAAAQTLGRLGDPRAIEPLAGVLRMTHHPLGTRRVAGRALVDLWMSGRMSAQDRQRLLAHRETIVAAHTDTKAHEDRGTARGLWLAYAASDCAERHVDYQKHTDHGLALRFPL